MNKALLLKLLLGLSLAFNAAVLINISCHGSHPYSMEDIPDQALHRLTMNLSVADAGIVHAAFDMRRDEFMKTRSKLHSDMIATDAAMRADPFDIDALRRAMNDVHRERTTFGSLIEECILQAAATITPEGRVKLLPYHAPEGASQPGASQPAQQ